MIAREEIGERTTDNDIQEGDRGEREDGTGEERCTCDRRNDEGTEGSESRCDRREVANREDYSKKGVKRRSHERKEK